jgi:plasmid stabilization system protein ParE
LIVKLSKHARNGIKHAVSWYKQEAGKHIAEEAVSAFEEAINKIGEQPEAYQEYALAQGVRRMVMDKFPYLIFYTIAPKEVVILSVLHSAQIPPSFD